jgi:Ubiquitin-activating enzyme E1 FCCH domain
MARKIIDTGVVGNDGTGDSIRDSFRKVNDNFRELYSSLGLGEKLTFRNLDDTPESYFEKENFILSVNNTETGIVYKQLIPGSGISLDFTTNAEEIRISSEFSEVVADDTPQLGGDLSARSGGAQHRIIDLGTNSLPLQPIFEHEAVNKSYADSKIARAGVNAIDPRTNTTNPSFGTMSGPLILSRDPEPGDDETYDGLIAATKRYVDNSAFGSSVNLYVATSGQDERPGVSQSLQGRALAYAYRTLESALKRAEEIMLDARLEIGPYKKVLTFNQGAGQCTLDEIDTAPSSGSGFSGDALMSVDAISINTVGTNYLPGDIITLSGGTFIEPARFEVLSTTATPGGVATFRQLSSGVYTALPTTVVPFPGADPGVPTSSDSEIAASGATFTVSYKVNNVIINSGGGGYGLVSVRISGGGGAGAFGTADVVSGIVQSITITDQGSGFTSVPAVRVDLPRFFIQTNGYRTDFTGDVTTNTPFAIRSRDIREGLFLRGETSGALAQILAHSGALDSLGRELFDVDLKSGSFVIGEVISYGDVTKSAQITILVESGIYEENLPLRIPQNVSIVGDEFRRCIIRPKPGVSSSPWAFLYFRRDLTIGQASVDQLQITDRLFGYHYLENTGAPVYPLVNNRGFYRSAAQLLLLNRQFIQREVVGWINNQTQNNISPFSNINIYNNSVYEREVGLIIDAIIFDLKWGGSNRTVSAALKYYSTDDSRFLIDVADGYGSETQASIRRINTLAQLVIRNVPVSETYQTVIPQIVDRAFVAEVGTGGTSFNISGVATLNPVVVTTSTAHGLVNGDQILISEVGGTVEINGNDFYVEFIDSTSFYLYNDLALADAVDGTNFTAYTSGGFATSNGGVIGALIDVIIDVVDGSGSVNYPKDNDQMDVALCNDAVRFQAITFQGHGGFAMVLDPEGQILAKSPYAQECSSFSKSTGKQTFAGGQYIDGFAGNLRFKILSKDSNTFLRVGNLSRIPQLPASFIVEDTVYRINYVRDFIFNVAGSTASFVLDESTPWPFDIFDYNEDICFRDVGLIIDGLGYDIVLGTNYHQRKSGLSYREANASVVIDEQLDLTVRAILQAHTLASTAVSDYPAAQAVVETSGVTISNIIRNGTTFAPVLSLAIPVGLSANITNAKQLLESNIGFIKDETIGYINATYPSPGFVYDEERFERNVQYIVEALMYDLIYGGNSETRKSGIRYYDGVGDAVVLQIPGEVVETADGIGYVSYLAQQVILNSDPVSFYSSTPRVTGTPATSAEASTVSTLMSNIVNIIVSGPSVAVSETLPDLNAYSYLLTLKNARTALVAAKTSVQNGTIDFIDENANIYEVLMPGNRSMLSNDFTQINDLGYGIVVNNGGLAECVSMFTYYAHISYYSVNGGQIRSVGGSSAHGNYALVAEGADPLEVPTPVTLYYDLSQGADVYYPTGAFANTIGGLVLFITNYDYVPLDNSELEVDHGLGSIFRYPVTSVSTSDLPPGVARLGLRSSEGAGIDGLAASIADGEKVTIRQNAQVVLTGDVVEVAVRPSTGLVLRESSDVYRILQFQNYVEPIAARTFTISIGSPAVITRSSHGLLPGYQIKLQTTGALPTGVDTLATYYVLSNGFTANSFRIGTTKSGAAINTTGTQSGTHSYTVEGLARTTLRENYNYVDLSIFSLQPFVTSGSTCTISIGSPGVITQVGHTFSVGDVIKFESTGSLPVGLSTVRHYFVNSVSGDDFTVSDVAVTNPTSPFFPTADIVTSGSQSGVHTSGLVLGQPGDSTFAVVGLGTDEAARVLNSKFVWQGQDYTITSYSSEAITGQTYAQVTVSPPLLDSVVFFTSVPTLKTAVPKDEPGTLTIRISLTRVTSHDLLEIGTGSYADTNYPSEIYGPPVNTINEANETEERGVGRVFYVTTDQFGNFSVGPYFRVDQGTGTVTFAAAIALSNLDGIGFKRGVPVSEFSTDTSMSDNATDTVPTENAVRTYIERRLGTSHTGAAVSSGSLIPSITGGFMSLDGQLSMKASMNLDSNKIINLADPTNPQDAVNLRSLSIDNLSDVAVTGPRSADILTFTGAGNFAQNSSMVGDISLNIDSTANTVDAQINPGVITNTDVNASAAIDQSKLSMLAATTRAAPTGITQADRGLASFDSVQFTATNGWLTVKDNGLTLTKLEQVATKTVLGNNTLVSNNVTAVPYTTVVNDGGAIKKSQYNTGTGYLRRIGFTTTNDLDYVVVDESSTNAVSTLVKRDSNGDFAARNVSVERLVVDTKIIVDTTTTVTGGYTQLHGFLSQVGILIGDGSVATDKRTFYDNDGHIFRTQNGLSNAPITASSIQVGTLTTGSASTSGTVIGNWSLGAGSQFRATYADLAEYYEADTEYPVGTILVFGGEKEVTLSSVKEDHRVAGVVSDQAAYIMNESCPGFKTLIALQGRVPCRVVGKIRKGDLMITSRIAGVAVSAEGNAKAGTIIGKALENYDSDHIGTIEVAVGRT